MELLNGKHLELAMCNGTHFPCDFPNAFHVYTEIFYQLSPDPSFIMRDTVSDLRWGWLGLAYKTRVRVRIEQVNRISV